MQFLSDLSTVFIESIDDTLDFIGRLARKRMYDYCDIEAGVSGLEVDKNGSVTHYPTFVSKGNSLGTVVQIRGIRKSLTVQAFHSLITHKLNSNLSPLFKKKGYSVQFYYSSDPYNVSEIIKSSLKPAEKAAKKLELDIADLFESRQKTLEKSIIDERIYMVIWTSPEVLSKDEKTRESAGSKKVTREIRLSRRDSLELGLMFPALMKKHDLFCRSLIGSMSHSGVVLRLLDLRDIYKEIKRSVDKDMPESWSPIVPGDFLSPSIRKKSFSRDRFEAQYPPTGQQLLSQSFTEENGKVLKVGNYYYSTFFVKTCPLTGDTIDFNSLVKLINDEPEKFPWRVSFFIDGGGLSGLGFKKLMSQLCTITSPRPDNRLITRAVTLLEEFEKLDISPIVDLRMAFSTWNKIDYEQVDEKFLVRTFDKVMQQRNKMIGKLMTWQETQVADEPDDTIDAMLSTSLALKQGSTAPKMPMPFFKPLSLLPLGRTTSPWESGGVIFHTKDGKIMPYQQMSKQQYTFNGLIYSGPGSGKSTLLNHLNAGFCYEETNDDFPFICNIDAGESSFGFASLMKEALPKNKQHYVETVRLTNSIEYAFNPFDTNTGCRYPMENEYQFLLNLMKVFLSKEGETVAKGMEGLIARIIKETYVYFSDLYHPKMYNKGINPIIDEAVKTLNIADTSKLTYWQIVDELFLKGKIREANLAQTFAMPTMRDLISVINQSDNAKSLYKIVKEEGNEDLISEFTRTMAEVIETYPVLSERTRIDFSNARILCIDLDSCKTGSLKHKTIMYMISIYMGTKNFYVHPQDANQVPLPESFPNISKTIPIEEYRKFHKRRFENMRTIKKRLNVDEYHLIAKDKNFANQIVYNMRLGRKYNVDIMILSQDLNDFSEEILKNMTSLFVMSTIKDFDLKKLQDAFKLDASDVEIGSRIGKQPEGFRTFMAKFDLGGIWTSFELVATLSPEELWAYESGALNASIRNYLYTQIGAKPTRAILSKLYPRLIDENAEEFAKASPTERQNKVEKFALAILDKAQSLGLA